MPSNWRHKARHFLDETDLRGSMNIRILDGSPSSKVEKNGALQSPSTASTTAGCGIA